MPFGKWKKEATDLFVSFFSQKFDESVLICSVTRSVITEEFLSSEERKSMTEMVSRGWIEPDKHDEDIHEEFRIHPLDNDDTRAVRSVCELVVGGHTHGHLFFVWEKDQLVMYPHEDDNVRFLSLSHDGKTGQISYSEGENYHDIVPNEISEAYTYIYDEEIRRSIGELQE